jgi:hypothetical protein
MLLGLLICGVAAVSLLPFSARADVASRVQFRVISSDSTAHPQMELLVEARDAYGHAIRDLKPSNYVIEEASQLVASSSLEVAPARVGSQPVTIAVVADISTLLSDDYLAAVKEDLRALALGLLDDQTVAAEVGLFVPRSAAIGQQLDVLPFTSDKTSATSTLDSLAPREGRTDLYNAIAATINATADRAAQRGGPAFVVVMSDGMDETSIVGGGIEGANEAARIAENRRVQVFTLGYGDELKQGAAKLAQLADRSKGQFAPNPDQSGLDSFIERFHGSTQGGIYTLRYRSSLPANGETMPLQVRLKLDGLEASASTDVLLPRPPDAHSPVQMAMELDSSTYPTITLLTRPITHLRRTAVLSPEQSLRLLLDGEALDVPLQVKPEALPAADPAAAQSVAVLLDAYGQEKQALQEQAVTFLMAETDVPSRAALFLPGAAAAPTEYTHDHNALINNLNQASPRASSPADLAALLRQAIESAAEDGVTHQRPAYVLLFSNRQLDADTRSQTLALARERGVTLHVVSTRESVGEGNQRLATASGGQLWQNSNAAQMQELASSIAADSAVRYRVQATLPLLADGQERTLALELGQIKAETNLTPQIAGPAAVQPGLPLVAMLLVFGAGALLLGAGALVPPLLRERRLRCPTCGRVRRASWGDTCLFCEHQVGHSHSNVGSDTGVQLEGFAQQGAALVGTRTPAPKTNPPAQPDPFPKAITPVTMFHQGRGPIIPPPPPQEPAIAPASPAQQASPAVPAANGTSHTDFWGPLPITSSPATNHSNGTAAHGGNGAAAPDDARAQSHTDFWGALPETESPTAHGTNGVAAVGTNGTAATASASAQPESHTDFWGPLPETGVATDHSAPPASAGQQAAPKAKPRRKAEAKTEAPAAPAAPARKRKSNASAAPAAPQPEVVSPVEIASAPEASTDFWGPAQPAAEVVTPSAAPAPRKRKTKTSEAAPAPQAEAASPVEIASTPETPTDFWGPAVPSTPNGSSRSKRRTRNNEV